MQSTIIHCRFALDNNFQIHRTCAKIRGIVIEIVWRLGKALRLSFSPINVCGGVLVLSKPSNYPRIPTTFANLKLADGIHP